MIKFKKVKLKNFFSVGNNPIEIIFKNGLNFIIGENLDKDRSNGSGKSTTIESVYFALFGKTIRGSNKTNVVNKKTKKGTEIELDFESDLDQYKIIRKVKPSELFLYKNGKDITRDSIPNTQNEIEKILGVTEDVIKNCVIMGINQTTPFMAQSKVDKRKFIEGIFDMAIFSEMLKLARSDYNDKTKELVSETSKKTEKEKSFVIYKDQSDKFEQSKKEKIEKIKADIKNENTNKLTLQKEFKICLDEKFSERKDSLQKDKQEFLDKRKTQIQPKLDDYNFKITEAKTEVRLLIQQVSSAFTSGVCPTCKRPMSSEDTNHAEKHIEEIQNNIKELNNKILQLEKKKVKVNDVESIIDSEINNIDKKINILDVSLREQDKIADKIQDCEDNIFRLLKNANSIKDEVNNLDGVIEKTKAELTQLESDIITLTDEIEILDQVKFILGENGVKSFIVNKLLNIFNKKLNYYLDKLNANCVVTFDEFFEEKIIDDKGHECSYFDFSSGERRNIDIAILFTFMDIQKVQGKFDCNLLVFDELIDGSLDANGVKFVIDILLEKCNNGDKSIYIVTHREKVEQYATGEIVKIQKKNNISTRIL